MYNWTIFEITAFKVIQHSCIIAIFSLIGNKSTSLLCVWSPGHQNIDAVNCRRNGINSRHTAQWLSSITAAELKPLSGSEITVGWPSYSETTKGGSLFAERNEYRNRNGKIMLISSFILFPSWTVCAPDWKFHCRFLVNNFIIQLNSKWCVIRVIIDELLVYGSQPVSAPVQGVTFVLPSDKNKRTHQQQ